MTAQSRSSTAASRGSCPPIAPAKHWQGTPNADYCANANCVERGHGLYGTLCYPPSAKAGTGTTEQLQSKAEPVRHEAPPRFTGHVAPDVQNDILALSDALLGKPPNQADRARRLRNLKRLMADHGVPMRPQDMACLQPVSAGELVEIPLRWHPYHIKKEAIDQSLLCDSVPEGDAKDVCREQKYGEAVMWAEPELAGQCRTANAPNFDADAIADCAKRKFLDAWAKSDGMISAPASSNVTLPAECQAAVPPAKQKLFLREQLRKRLAEAASKEKADDDRPARGPSMAAKLPLPKAPEPPAPDEDEAYCSYMAREVVRGELVPSPNTAIPAGCRATIAAALALKAKHGDEPFAMNADETDREIAKLLGPSSGQIGTT